MIAAPGIQERFDILMRSRCRSPLSSPRAKHGPQAAALLVVAATALIAMGAFVLPVLHFKHSGPRP
eukprot:1924973-Pyramimonas_sp.AAC.1